MNRQLFAPMFAAAVMLAGAHESYGGETMKSELLTVKETAIVDLGAAVARGDQKNLAAALNRGFDNGLTLAEAKEFQNENIFFPAFSISCICSDDFMWKGQFRR